VGGAQNIGGTGGSVELQPATAPACTSDSTPNSTPNSVSSAEIEITGEGQVFNVPHFVRVLEKGLGSPPGESEADIAVAGNGKGWLRVAVVDAVADAGAPSADAEPYDVSLSDGLPQLVIMGPRQVGELPVTAGEVLQLTHEHVAAAFYQHDRVLLQRDDSVLLYDAFGNTDDRTPAGFTVTLASDLCARPYPSAATRCGDMYRIALDVSVPGGATATFLPGEERVVGNFRVFNKYDEVFRHAQPYTGNTACADAMSWGGLRLIQLAEAP
jgi:hypothetical protein